ncbi:MAG: alkaline phosphatase D family protein [Betaproteobacteria bacterium]
MTDLPRSFDRRRILELALASAAGCWVPGSARGQPRFTTNPFALGVASGSPTHDSVVLWTRLVSEGLFGSDLGREPITVRWELAHDENFKALVRSGQASATPELAHSVHVDVAGLDSDRWYHYRFLAGDAASAPGRTRTFPAPDAKPSRMRAAYASCQRWEHGYFSAYRHMRKEDPDVVLFLGDYIYEYPNASKAVRKPSGGWVLTLGDYRQRYALMKSDVDLQAMHAACPWLMVWDDHEVQNDYAGMKEGDSGSPVADFAARRAAAYQAYYEHMPLRASVLTRALDGLATGAEMRIYSEVRFGQLATFYLVDDRQYRDPQVCTRGGKAGSSTVNPATCADWLNPDRTLLGAAQERWLDAAFAQAGKGWNVLGLQTVFGQRDFKSGPGQTLWNDGWDGYPAARGRMITSMRKHELANPVLLGGDVHENWVGHVKADYADPASAPVGVEFCGTSISARSEGNAQLPARLAENPHFIFADSERRGYGVVDVSEQKLTASLRVVDDVTRRDTTIETLAKFSVEAGRPVIERA